MNQNKTIYILPNLFTSASLFSGFFAIISAFNNQFILAAICIFLAALMDSLDGRVARLINAQSAFGAEYDSLADVVSFGVAPALLIYFWTVHYLNQVGWAIAFIYLACVSLRLARFNTKIDLNNDKNDTHYFYGLPCPAAAMNIAGFVWFFCNMGFLGSEPLVTCFSLMMIIYLSIMMISNVKFRSFKDFSVRKKMIFIHSISIIFFIIIIFIEPSITLFIILSCYSLSGIVRILYFRYFCQTN